MAKVLPYAGVNCDKDLNICKVWWLATIDSKMHNVELVIPMKIKNSREEREKELELDELFRDSRAII